MIDKIMTPQQMLGERQRLRAAGVRLVFTNGVFDLLHIGHVRYLAQARALGREYGRMAMAGGLPLSEALEAALFFRDLLVETALNMPENTRIRPEANLRLLRKINQLLNTIQLQIAEYYENAA